MVNSGEWKFTTQTVYNKTKKKSPDNAIVVLKAFLSILWKCSTRSVMSKVWTSSNDNVIKEIVSLLSNKHFKMSTMVATGSDFRSLETTQTNKTISRKDCCFVLQFIKWIYGVDLQVKLFISVKFRNQKLHQRLQKWILHSLHNQRRVNPQSGTPLTKSKQWQFIALMTHPRNISREISIILTLRSLLSNKLYSSNRYFLNISQICFRMSLTWTFKHGVGQPAKTPVVPNYVCACALGQQHTLTWLKPEAVRTCGFQSPGGWTLAGSKADQW